MRKFLALAAKAAVSLALLYFAVGRVNLGMLGERLAQVDVGWLLAAMAIEGAQIGLMALRWQQIAAQCGAPTPLPRMFRFSAIASFFNQTLPSTVGGDATRVWMLAREGAGWAKATYSVLIDRAAGVLTLAVIVVVCMPWSFDLIRDPVGRAAMALIGLGCIFGPLVFLALGARPWPMLDRWWLTRHLAEAARLAYGMFLSARSGASLIAQSLVVHAMTFAAVWCVAKSVAAPLSLAHVLLVVPPVLLISTIPVSVGGWGVRESAMVLGFAYAGLPESDGLLVSLLFGATMFGVGLIGGAVWLASPGVMRVSDAPREEAAPDNQTR